MNRRAFLSAASAALLAAPLAAEAQQPGRRVPRVGVLWQGTPSALITLRSQEAFLRGLRDYGGYVEGANIAIENRYGNLDASVASTKYLARLNTIANDLVRLKVDVIVVGSTPAALAAKRATNTTPIVAWAMADPVADGLVASLGRPGGNVTGSTFLGPELDPKRLQLMREAVPGVSRVAVLQQPGAFSERTMRDRLKGITAAAVGIGLQVVEASSPNDFDTAFSAMAKAHAGALVVLSSPMFYINHRRLVDLAAKHRLPTMYVFREAVEAGGLISYGANLFELARRGAAYVDKILKGAKPADLPVEQPTKFELVINLKTAKALGLTIPQTLLLRADQVIE